MIFLRGKELQTMYRPCYLDAQASATKSRCLSLRDPALPGLRH